MIVLPLFPKKILAEKITKQANDECKHNSFFYAMLHLNGLKHNQLKGRKKEFVDWFSKSTQSSMSGIRRGNEDVCSAIKKDDFSRFVPHGYSILAEAQKVRTYGEILTISAAEARARTYLDKLASDPKNTALIFDNDAEYGLHSYMVFANQGKKKIDLCLVDTLRVYRNGFFADEPVVITDKEAVHLIISNKYVVPNQYWTEQDKPRISSHVVLHQNKMRLASRYDPAHPPEGVLIGIGELLLLRKVESGAERRHQI